MHDTTQSYQDFLASKRHVDPPTGFEVDPVSLSPHLFDFQRHVTAWAIQRGRAAVFADCGLGKTLIQLQWAQSVHKHTQGNVLIFAPLAVAKQTAREGDKFGFQVNVCRKQGDVKSGINVTNYEMMQHFDPSQFVALVADESSILKGVDAKTRLRITEFAQTIPFRLACTATPAPNDTQEVINHSEFLGIMNSKEVLALFFTQDFTATSHKWRLKGHARKAFWTWLASWARAFRKPSDLGFDDDGFNLPALHVHHEQTETNPYHYGSLFPVEAEGIKAQREARRASLDDRVKLCADLVNNSDEQWIVWCELNSESDAITKAIPGAVNVQGSDSMEFKEKWLLAFAAGELRVLVSKGKIAGWGMNFQSCHNVAFLGLGNSWEMYYQTIRRCWRFGQEHEVHVHVITADTDGPIIRNIKRKEAEASTMFTEIVNNTADDQRVEAKREEAPYEERIAEGKGWELWLGDSVETIDHIETESVGLIVYSPPFVGMYTFTNSPRDIGNTRDIQELIGHYRYLIAPDKMFRIIKPGRSCCVHLCQGIAFKGVDGYSGLKDFRGEVIRAHEDAGWIYYGEVCIEKNPQLRALRSKDRGLLFKTLASDSSHARMGLADYVLQFRKPGDNHEPIKAGMADHLTATDGGNSAGWITNQEWIEWASPVWWMYSKEHPDGIRESDTLSTEHARDTEDEKHLCALQLSVIERCVKLWSNPGDIVYDPFTGIGSTGVQALRLGRKFVGGELKESYFKVAAKYLKAEEQAQPQMNLFSGAL